MNILVADDEVRLAKVIGQLLEEQKYHVDLVYDGRDAYDYAITGNYDILVLDVMMPYMSGFDVVQRLRKEGLATPIILLTAKDAWQSKVQGLDLGADDYLTKPFQPEELLARVRALTRRTGEVILDTLTFEDLTLNLSTYDLSTPAKSVHLGFKEYEVLKILLSNPRSIVPKEDLITKVWGYDSDAEDNNVEAYISFLRKKLTFLQSRVQIGTVRRVGYKLTVDGVSGG